MSRIPKATGLDSTLALAKAGYRYISQTCEQLGSPVFQTRLLLQRTVCMRGEWASRVMYDNPHLLRHGAVPSPVLKTLMGERGVQTLDGEQHRERKQMFVSLLTGDNAVQVADQVKAEWEDRLAKWEQADQVVLHDATAEILCLAICKWAGVPVGASELARRTADFKAMIGDAASIGDLRARAARRRAEAWVRDFMEAVRNQSLTPPDGTALKTIALYREHGELLNAQVAAVELINILRPAVAIAWYITFLALALHAHPEQAEKLRSDDTEYPEMFVQEVRRFYPFFPFVGAIIREGFVADGYGFPAGDRLVLDLYGSNHDPQVWPSPEHFDPERFRGWPGDPNRLIPQGGGDVQTGHRCPGEEITIEVMKVAVQLLTRSIGYDVPPQDLSFSLSSIPTQPKSGFVMTSVRRR